MIVIGSDHAGFLMKEVIKKHLEKKAIKYIDVGTNTIESCDYPLIAKKAISEMRKYKDCKGILICGSGIGISISANKFKGIRAALCYSAELAEMSRKHNDANIICIGGRYISEEEATKAIDLFLTTSFEGGRHGRRVDEIKEIELENN